MGSTTPLSHLSMMRLYCCPLPCCFVQVALRRRAPTHSLLLLCIRLLRRHSTHTNIQQLGGALHDEAKALKAA